MTEAEAEAQSESESDGVLRAMTNDGAFRVIAARTTDTVRAVTKIQGDTDTGTDRDEDVHMLGGLLTGAALYRETMAPGLRVQCIFQGAENTANTGRTKQWLAESHPEGWCRGLVQTQTQRQTQSPTQSKMATLQMMRSLPNGALHRGVVEVAPEETLSQALMGYMQHSEQVLSMIAVGVVQAQADVVAAGGYVVQVLPEATDHEGALMLMTERLRDFDRIEARLAATDASARELIKEIFYGMDFTWLGESALRAGCNCSRVRVLTSLGTVGKEEIRAMVAAREPLEMSCDYCKTDYVVGVEELRGLLTSA